MARKSNIVKKTKGTINLLVIAMLVIGWLCAIVTMTADREAQEQTALILTAKTYIEDKLYIRAVKNYKTALNDYSTEKNQELETELVSIYLEAGMMDEYYDLINARVEKGTAAENEYKVLAQLYIENGSDTKAINVLTRGIECYASEEMIQMKEQIVYANKARTVNLPELKQPADNWLVPAYDGNKWGYVAGDGSVLLDFIYEEATPFCDGYAVVKLDGVYTLIDQNGYWNAVDKNELELVKDLSSSAMVGVKDGKYQIYSRTFKLLSEEAFDDIYMNDNGLYVVQKAGKWAILSASLEPVTDYVYTDVAVNSRGKVFTGSYAMVKDEKGYFLVNQEGAELYQTRFAEAKGYEGGLCAVADESGMWGFANGKAEMIVDYQYGDAKSFSCNLGAVEYGGKWGYINRYNTMVIEPEYVQAYPFIEGAALVETDMGNYQVLTLKYFELF